MRNWLRTTAIGLLGIGIFLGVAGAGISEVSDEIQSAYDYPVRAFNDGNYRIALRGFENFIEQYPDHKWTTEARFYKGESLLHLEKYDRAMDALLKVLKEDPGFSNEKMASRLAFAAEQTGRQDELRPYLSLRFLHQYPKLQNHYIDWFYQEDSDQVLSKLKAIEPEQRTANTRKLLENSELDNQVRRLLKAIREDRWNRTIREDLGILEANLRQNLLALGAKRLWEQGKKNQIIRFGRRVPQGWGGLDFSLYVAEAAIDQEQWDLARTYYRGLIDRLDYTPPKAAYGLAWIHYQEGNLNRAQDEMKTYAWQHLSGELGYEGLRLQGDIAFDAENYSRARDRYYRALERSAPEQFTRETRYWLARTHIQLDEPQAALEELEGLEPPESIPRADYLEARGVAAQQTANWKLAEKSFGKALEKVNDTHQYAEIQYRLARVKFQQQNYEQSQQLLERLRTQSLPKKLSRSVDLALSNLLYEKGKPRRVRDILDGNRKQLQEFYPVRYYALFAWANRELGQISQASSRYRTLIKRYPNTSEAQEAYRGLFQLGLNYPDQIGMSSKQLRNLINQADPEQSQYMVLDWAQHHRDRGNTSRARELFNEVLSGQAPKMLKAEATDGLVRIELNNGRLEGAIEQLESAESFAPHPVLAGSFYRFFQVAYERQEFDSLQRAGRIFERSFEVKQSPPEVVFMLAELKRHQEQLETAKQRYQKVVDETQKTSLRDQALYRLAQINHETRNIRAANRYLDQLERPGELPNSEAVYYRIAKVRFLANRLEDAKKAVEKLPDKPSFRLLRGKIQLREGRVERAREIIQSVKPGEQPSELHPERLYWLARVHEELGNLKKAEEYLYEVRYRYPDWDRMDRIYERLIAVLRQLDRPDEARRLEERQARGRS